MKRDGDLMRVIDALARQVGSIGVLSDWPAAVTFYANRIGLKQRDPVPASAGRRIRPPGQTS